MAGPIKYFWEENVRNTEEYRNFVGIKNNTGKILNTEIYRNLQKFTEIQTPFSCLLFVMCSKTISKTIHKYYTD